MRSKNRVIAFHRGMLVSFVAILGLTADVVGANTSLDYVQTGLVAHWDAIDNQAYAPHDNAATDWVDLVAGRTFTLHDCTFFTASLSFSGVATSFGELSAVDTTNTFLKAKGGMIEIVFRYGREQPAADSGSPNETILQSGATNGPVLAYSTAGSLWFLRTQKTGTASASAGDFGVEKVTTYAIKYASDGSVAKSTDNVFYADGTMRKTGGGEYGYGEHGEKSYIGRRFSETSPLPYAGQILAIRVYSSPLSAEQVAANAALDQQRFAAKDNEPLANRLRIVGLPDAYGPAENYGDKHFESGGVAQYVMSETWTDPDSGVVYRCAGWGLKDGFGNIVETGTGNVCDYTHPNAYRQLVWLWTADAWPTGVDVCYVAPDGDDTNSGADWLHAFKTVQRGVNESVACGTVMVAAGTFGSSGPVVLRDGISLVGCAKQNTGTVLSLTAKNDKTLNVLQMLASSGSVVTNLTLTNNSGSDGSGVEMDGGVLTHCVVRNCRTSNLSDWGAGINMTGGTVRVCLITGCVAKDSGGGWSHGNGIYMKGSSCLVENCRIVDNGIYTDTPEAGSVGCGGGVYMEGGTLRSCLIARNRKYQYGSGVFVKSGGIVENCTIVDNTQNDAKATASGVWIQDAGSVFRNNILWGNTAYDGTTAKDWSYASSVKAANVYNNDSPTLIALGSNNRSVNPMFVDAAAGDYHLGYSGCVNGGSNLTWMVTATDMDGRARIINDVVDLGCYEREESSEFECAFSAVAEKGLDNVSVALQARVVGATAGLVYYWTFTRADGLVQTVSGSEYGNFTHVFVTGVWNVRLDVTNAHGQSAHSFSDRAVDARASAAYVSKTGSKTYPYATPETATDDIDAAFPLLGDTGTLYVDEGEYVITKPLELVGDNGSRIVAPKGPDLTSIRVGNVAKFTSEKYLAVTLGKSSAYVSGVTLAGGYKGPYHTGAEYGIYGVATMKAAGSVITNCVFRDIKHATWGLAGMGVNMSAGLLVDCRFKNVSAAGSGGSAMHGGTLRMSGGTADRIRIEGCFTPTAIISATGYGDIVYADGSGTVLKNALIARCQTHKSVPVGVNNSALINCTVVCNTNAAPASGTSGGKPYYNDLSAGVTAYGSARVKNCIIVDNWSKTCGCVSNLNGKATYTLVNDRDASFVTAENHNLLGDPGFVDAAAGDFRLQPSSQAVNAGDWTALGETMDNVKAQFDLIGVTRLVGANVEMGCCEQNTRGFLYIIK